MSETTKESGSSLGREQKELQERIFIYPDTPTMMLACSPAKLTSRFIRWYDYFLRKQLLFIKVDKHGNQELDLSPNKNDKGDDDGTYGPSKSPRSDFAEYMKAKLKITMVFSTIFVTSPQVQKAFWETIQRSDPGKTMVTKQITENKSDGDVLAQMPGQDIVQRGRQEPEEPDYYPAIIRSES